MKSYLNKFYVLVGFLFLVLALPAQAHPGHGAHQRHGHHGHQHHHHRPPMVIYRDGWVVPLIGGAVIGAIVSESARRQDEQTTVIIDRDARAVCSEWREIQTPDGKIYRERTCRTLQD